MVKTLDSEEMYINMGPQHPSTHGVLRLMLRTDGEIVTEVVPVVGYLHRCAEKIAENVTYVQYVPYTDRMDYLSSMSDNLGFALATESLMDIEIPARAQAIRVLMAELNRIASHLLAVGTFGIDIGAYTPFLWCFRERESILNLFEIASGARLTYNYVRIGGVMRDIGADFIKKCEDFLRTFPKRVEEYNNLLSYNKIFISRTGNIGVMPKELALAYGVTGPMLRASGLAMDVRKSEPYSGYEKYNFNIPVGTGRMGAVGDCWDRYYVKILEMMESLKIVEQVLGSLPKGEIVSKQLKKVIKTKKGEKYVRIENPRGELGFYVVSNGTDKPYRVKVRAPSFCNLSVLTEISRNVMIGDLVAILGSTDIVLGEIDR